MAKCLWMLQEYTVSNEENDGAVPTPRKENEKIMYCDHCEEDVTGYLTGMDPTYYCNECDMETVETATTKRLNLEKEAEKNSEKKISTEHTVKFCREDMAKAVDTLNKLPARIPIVIQPLEIKINGVLVGYFDATKHKVTKTENGYTITMDRAEVK